MQKWFKNVNIYGIAAGLYILLPLVVFLLGWLRIEYAIPVILMLIVLMFSFSKELRTESLLSGFSYHFWAISILTILLWVYLSGMDEY